MNTPKEIADARKAAEAREAQLVDSARAAPDASTRDGVIGGRGLRWKPAALHALHTLSGIAPDGVRRSLQIHAALGNGGSGITPDPVKSEHVYGTTRVTSTNPQNPWHAFIGADPDGVRVVLVLHIGKHP